MEKQSSNVADITSEEKKQKAIIIFLESLEDNSKAEKAVSYVTAIDLNADKE